MMTLTFGEQVKIVLSRKNMTIKELAELIEEQTGTKMSRQNLTQRLGRDNFQEQDMRMIADILGCSFQLNILDNVEVSPKKPAKKDELPISIVETKEPDTERDMTLGELQDILEHPVTQTMHEITPFPEVASPSAEEPEATSQPTEKQEPAKEEPEPSKEISKDISTDALIEPFTDDDSDEFRTRHNIKEKVKISEDDFEEEVAPKEKKPEEILGEVNPYTGKEYKTNSVRVHPKRIGYVQVYDQSNHKWTDMTEWAFLGYQERKRALLGKEYEPPIYLD